jgi:hypothetical protein
VALALQTADRRFARVARASLAFVAGLLPLLAYNTITQGQPFAFTQGREFRGVFQSGLLGVPAVLLGGVSYVSGGGFRLVHFPSTFAAHLRYLTAAFGVFFWPALGMLVVGSLRRLPIARILGPYVVIGLLFYSCWGHGDPRYLVGVSLALIVLAASVLVLVAERLADPRTRRAPRVVAFVAIAAALVVGVLFPRHPARGLGTLERTAALSLLAAGVTTVVAPARVLAPLAPALGFAGFGVFRMLMSSGSTEGGFRAADVDRARRTIEGLVPAGSLVVMSHSLGRPAENWTHYTHADAHYVGELHRLLSDPNIVGWRCTDYGRPFFIVIAIGEPAPFTVPPRWLEIREVAINQGQALRDWFVDPKRAPNGVVLYEVAIRVNRRAS